jgi:general secretion pathway protein B
MSIIANALQKQNQHLLEKQPENNNSFIWKALLLSALLVIILLLSVLIWILTKPPVIVSSQIPQTEVVVKSPIISPQVTESVRRDVVEQKMIEFPTIPVEKPIAKVSFETKPLPLIDLNEMNAISDDQASSVLVDTLNANNTDNLQTDLNSPIDNDTDLKASEISEKLKVHLQEALINIQGDDINIDDSDDLNIYKMDTDFQQQVPTIRYAFHVYSSEKKERWIRINGEDLKVGEFDSSGKIEVVDIQPNKTIFRVVGKEFYLKSLTDWLAL